MLSPSHRCTSPALPQCYRMCEPKQAQRKEVEMFCGFVASTGESPFSAAPWVSASEQVPKRIGACSVSTTRHDTRFSVNLVEPKEADFGDGTSIKRGNDADCTSYDYVAGIGRSRTGDRVMTCLISARGGCLKDGDCGKFYTKTNLCTRETLALPASQHMCDSA